MSEYPWDIAEAHGRIAAYRFALAETVHALTEAMRYIDAVTDTREAAGMIAGLNVARLRAAAELAVPDDPA